VQIINAVRLCDFWAEHGRAEQSLRAWYQLVSGYDWSSPEEFCQTFPAAQFHEELVAFDLHGGSYFVIITVDYERAVIWVRDVQVHSDFRTGQWHSLSAVEQEDGRAYNELVETFPLRPIRDIDSLRQATSRIDALLSQANRSLDEQDYLDVLSLLAAEYERRHIEIPPVSSGEIVRMLISEHRMSQVEIIPLLGGKQKALALLQGTRPLEMRQATRVARYFKLPVESFMDPDDLEIELPKPSRRRR
jgi:mRNA-degrading endonuclease HigB of HigAB toxin-antitoxin module/antitoxin component HigA of HigAB toxin-antitoxin module